MSDAREVLAKAIGEHMNGPAPQPDLPSTILAALAAAGLAVVPREPTMKMKIAGGAASRMIWLRMLTAASEPKSNL